ncbi:MAG: hypothetical protein SPL30_05900 [Succinivibrio sp.]|nr:hypothetical protein [Succinivibrio sp.]
MKLREFAAWVFGSPRHKIWRFEVKKNGKLYTLDIRADSEANAWKTLEEWNNGDDMDATLKGVSKPGKIKA